MAEPENRQTVERALAAVNRHDIDAYLATVDESFIWNNDIFPRPLRGREAVREALVSLFSAFPDFHLEIQQVITSGDHVVTRTLVSATHKGEFRGVVATNRQVHARACTVSQVRNSHIVKSDTYGDQLALMQQLGVSLTKSASATG